jgi:hypothetical protein
VTGPGLRFLVTVAERSTRGARWMLVTALVLLIAMTTACNTNNGTYRIA